MTDLTFVHLSDVHILGHENDRYLDQDTAAKFRRALKAIRDMRLNPSFFIISGDLIHEQDPIEAYGRFNMLLEEMQAFKVPVLLALGNHDLRAPFYRVVLDKGDWDDGHRYHYSRVIEDLHIIVLDTKVPGYVYGEIDDEQLAWLERELATYPERPKLLVCHHPPVPTPLAAFEKHLLSDADKLANLLVGRNVLGILSGHVHFTNIGTLQGIPCITATGLAFTIDPHASDGMYMLDGSGFNVINVRRGHLIVSPVSLTDAQRIVHRQDVTVIRTPPQAHPSTPTPDLIDG